MLARGELTEGHARAVLALPDDGARLQLARRIARDGMTVRAAEKAARDGGARRKRARSSPVDPALAERARGAAERVTGLPARVSAGKLEVHFGDETRLAELVEALEAVPVHSRSGVPPGAAVGD
jgi:ParB family chromosome partitioning protein